MEFFVIWLVIAVVFAFVCGKLAAGKGRSPVGYGLLGFVLPLIGLIVVLVVPRADASTKTA